MTKVVGRQEKERPNCAGRPVTESVDMEERIQAFGHDGTFFLEHG
jgi:hypothetical protein